MEGNGEAIVGRARERRTARGLHGRAHKHVSIPRVSSSPRPRGSSRVQCTRFAQAVAFAQAKVTLISPFVGRLNRQRCGAFAGRAAEHRRGGRIAHREGGEASPCVRSPAIVADHGLTKRSRGRAPAGRSPRSVAPHGRNRRIRSTGRLPAEIVLFLREPAPASAATPPLLGPATLSCLANARASPFLRRGRSLVQVVFSPPPGPLPHGSLADTWRRPVCRCRCLIGGRRAGRARAYLQTPPGSRRSLPDGVPPPGRLFSRRHSLCDAILRQHVPSATPSPRDAVPSAAPCLRDAVLRDAVLSATPCPPRRRSPSFPARLPNALSWASSNASAPLGRAA